MLSVEAPRDPLPPVRLLLDRVALLVEVEEIAIELTALEQQYGPHGDIEDVRRRLHDVCRVVLAQLRGLLAGETETIH